MDEGGAILGGLIIGAVIACAALLPWCCSNTVSQETIDVPNHQCTRVNNFLGSSFILCKGDCQEYDGLKLCFDPKVEKQP